MAEQTGKLRASSRPQWVIFQRPLTAQGLLPYLLLLPAMLAIGAVIIYPLIYNFEVSLTNANLLRLARREYVGLANYQAILGGSVFWESLWATAQYTVGTVLLSFLVGLGTALMLNVDFRFRALARALIIIPWATPWLVVTLIWYVMFNPQIGPINEILKGLGIIQTSQSWLNQGSTAMGSIIIVTAWRLFPAATLLILAGLQSISPELYEAAMVDGAGQWARFRFITMPSLRTVNFVVIVLLIIWSSKLYTVVWVLTQGGPGNTTRVLSVFTYLEAFSFNRVGNGATIATLSFLLSIGLVALYFRALRKEERELH